MGNPVEDSNAGSGTIMMGTAEENMIACNPWTEVGCSVSTNIETGFRTILSIEFDHENGYSNAVMSAAKNELIIQGMNRLIKDDFLHLTDAILQKLNAKQVPV